MDILKLKQFTYENANKFMKIAFIFLRGTEKMVIKMNLGVGKEEMKMSKNLCAHHALKFISFNAIH